MTPVNVDLRQQLDEVLVRHAVSGNRAAFDELVRRYCRPLAEFVSSRTSTVQDAEDIVQETFLRAFLNLRSFNAKYSLKNWLFTIAYRLVISDYRKKKPMRLNEKVACTIAAEEQAPDSQNSWIWKLARRISEDDYDVLWLRYKQQMSTEEIAEVIGKSNISVRVRLHRARKRLAKEIQARHAESPVWAAGEVCVERVP